MKKILFILPILISALYSCDSWIEVRPYDRMSSDRLFETRAGFEKALNGIYIGMAGRSVYGRQMTVEMIDIMGQYYTTLATNNKVAAIRVYNYENADFKKDIADAWAKYYSLIGDCNALIEECGDSNSVLPGFWHGLIKGEALALRGFLHFDVLRFWGPVYAHDPDGKYIPYRKTADPTVEPLISAKEFLGYVIEDLEEAVGLLKASDPILTNGVSRYDDGENNSQSMRQLRMNYFAAKLILTRAYHWKGDASKAYTLAKEIISESQGIFSFTDPATYQNTNRVPDRNFTPEIFFALADQYRQTQVFQQVLDPQMNSASTNTLVFAFGATIHSGKIAQVYPDPMDARFQFWSSSTSTDGSVYHFSKKFYPIEIPSYFSDGEKFNANLYNKLLPLVRMTEAYYIAAETAPTVSEGCELINLVLKNRQSEARINTSEKSELMTMIEAEYKREFMSEGQLFFLYKRLGKTVLPASTSASTGTISMNLSQYAVPLPEAEKSNRDDAQENKD